MKELHLTAKGKEQELILAYLKENASEILVEKINNGTPIEKYGKTLVNRKTLDGFMTFAAEEARKRAAKGARSACVEDAAVYGWAVHYFEEDSIEGTLYNADGMEYKPPKPKYEPKAVSKPAESTTPQPRQQTLFDLMPAHEVKPEETEQTEDLLNKSRLPKKRKTDRPSTRSLTLCKKPLKKRTLNRSLRPYRPKKRTKTKRMRTITSHPKKNCRRSSVN